MVIKLSEMFSFKPLWIGHSWDWILQYLWIILLKYFWHTSPVLVAVQWSIYKSYTETEGIAFLKAKQPWNEDKQRHLEEAQSLQEAVGTETIRPQ